MILGKEETIKKLWEIWEKTLLDCNGGVKVVMSEVPIDKLRELYVKALKKFVQMELKNSSNGNILNSDTVKDFIMYRKRDIWSTEYEQHKLGGIWD